MHNLKIQIHSKCSPIGLKCIRLNIDFLSLCAQWKQWLLNGMKKWIFSMFELGARTRFKIVFCMMSCPSAIWLLYLHNIISHSSAHDSSISSAMHYYCDTCNWLPPWNRTMEWKPFNNFSFDHLTVVGTRYVFSHLTIVHPTWCCLN